MLPKEVKNFGIPAEKSFIYSQAVKVGDIVYLSGQLSHDEEGNLVGAGDYEVQTRQTYDNILTLLGRYGLDLGHIVDETIYVLGLPDAFRGIIRVRREIYREIVPPASTIVAVTALGLPDQLVEIKAVAHMIPPGR